MNAATHLTPAGKVLDGLSRAITLLREHDDQPAASVTVLPHGMVQVDISSVHTYDEPARRAAVDAFATVLHLEAAHVKAGSYTSSNSHWRISTLVKSTTRCEHCGGIQ